MVVVNHCLEEVLVRADVDRVVCGGAEDVGT